MLVYFELVHLLGDLIVIRHHLIAVSIDPRQVDPLVDQVPIHGHDPVVPMCPVVAIVTIEVKKAISLAYLHEEGVLNAALDVVIEIVIGVRRPKPAREEFVGVAQPLELQD